MKIFFTREEITELKDKVESALTLMREFPPEKDSKEAGVFEALEAFLTALENLDR